MKGYIYTLYAGADPSTGWILNDPIFGRTPTLGACVPNIRKFVHRGDWVYAISGRVPGKQQFVVGGLRVSEKIDALAAYNRFPENRLDLSGNGQSIGNVIVTEEGKQHPDDRHSNFERRIENYLVGDKCFSLETEDEFDRSRAETLSVLQDIFQKEGNRVFDVVGRFRKVDEDQILKLNKWLESIKTEGKAL